MATNAHGVSYLAGMLLLTFAACSSEMTSRDPGDALGSTVQSVRYDQCLAECDRQFDDATSGCDDAPPGSGCWVDALRGLQFCRSICSPGCDDEALASCQNFCDTLPDPSDRSICFADCRADNCD